jgi:hypothetical protein
MKYINAAKRYGSRALVGVGAAGLTTLASAQVAMPITDADVTQVETVVGTMAGVAGVALVAYFVLRKLGLVGSA